MAIENLDVVAWWGAVVATVLGAVQIHDRLFHKPTPEITFLMSGSAEVGNHITAINATNVPMLITGWELYWGKVKGFGLHGECPSPRGTSKTSLC